ncbi:hypothetical protein BJ138DRAFT_1130150 [Hygrophoropsis aurantiaca]|uniref:Uncharacterized protein n=1 Tax=Hygrophoropsis aurantiaca TaxID=72124 RepID=A0ACB7ZYB7_9AGAM|nr:hypothetical protein BJ138DRAFT_1130150 [Hygrophoropsis aurantiaca]
MVPRFCPPTAPFPLLPNLRSLDRTIESHLHCHDSALPSSRTLEVRVWDLSRLLSPSLRTLEVNVWDFHIPPNPRYQYRLSLPIDEIRSSLRYFAEVEDPDRSDTDNLFSAVKRSLKELQNLDTITWKDLGSEAILSLAQLPALRHATFDVPVDFATYIELRSPTAKHPFSRLDELEITHQTDASVATFLYYFDFHSLKNICITSSCPSASMGTQAFNDALTSSLSCETIREISIFDQSSASTSNPAGFHPIGINELRPLLRLDGLKYMSLGVQHPIVLDDAMLLALAEAWPHLVTLHLNQYRCWHAGSHVTPPAFITLLERCPDLEEPSIPLDLSTVDSEAAGFDTTLSPIKASAQDGKGARAELTELWLGPYTITHPHAVARFLDAVLPESARTHMLSSRSEEVAACDRSFRQTIEYRLQMRKEKREQCGQ